MIEASAIVTEDVSPASPDSGNGSRGTPASSSGAAFTPPTVEEMNAALPQYRFVELIGVGGMGAVYKALQPKLNRHVAIKILPPRVNVTVTPGVTGGWIMR